MDRAITNRLRARGCVRGAGLFEGLNFPSIKLDKTRSRSSCSEVFGVLPRNHHCSRSIKYVRSEGLIRLRINNRGRQKVLKPIFGCCESNVK